MVDNGWRVIGDRAAAWFERPSLTASAELVRRIAATGPLPDLDVRPSGVRVRVALDDDTEAISALAGVPGDPAALQELRIVLDAADVVSVGEFWRAGFGYQTAAVSTPRGQSLRDPLRRDPEILVLASEDVRPLRDRFHIDVGRPEDVVEKVRAGRQPTGPWGVMLPDSEGNELDLVPGDVLAPAASDWQTLFAAMTFYPTTSPTRAVQLVAAVAELADAAGIALMLDIREQGVLLDHGKDAWEEAGSAFLELAVQVQAAARALGLTANAEPLRFVQLGIAAIDVPAVQTFWSGALGYAGESDSDDPRRLNPGFIFQQSDAGETARRQQRNRIRLELDVAHDQLPARVEQALRAGGQVRAEQSGRCSLADPEGNELDLIAQKPW